MLQMTGAECGCPIIKERPSKFWNNLEDGTQNTARDRVVAIEVDALSVTLFLNNQAVESISDAIVISRYLGSNDAILRADCQKTSQVQPKLSSWC